MLAKRVKKPCESKRKINNRKSPKATNFTREYIIELNQTNIHMYIFRNKAKTYLFLSLIKN